MIKLIQLPLLGVALTIASTSSPIVASRCHAEENLFTDDFTKPDPAWGTDATIANGKLTITADVDRAKMALNQTNVFQDFTLVITTRIVSGSDDSCAGVIFLVKSTTDFYKLNYNARGQLTLARYVGVRWLYPISWRECPELKKGVGDLNLLKIVVRGKEATININGKDYVSCKVQIPDGGGGIGVSAEAGPNEKCVCEFSNLTVTK